MLQPPTKRVGTHISPSPLFRIRLRDTLISKAAMRKSFQTAGRSPLGYLFGIAVPQPRQPANWLMAAMSALGQKQTFKRLRLMSALPPKADINQHHCDVRFVPKADSCT